MESFIWAFCGLLMTNCEAQFRLLSAVKELLQSTPGQRLLALYARSLAVRSLRASLEEARAAIRPGSLCPSREELFAAADG